MLERYLNLMAEQSVFLPSQSHDFLQGKHRRQNQEATVSTEPQITQEIKYVKESTHETQEVSKNSREHEEWKESRTESQDTSSSLLDLHEESGLIDLSSPQRLEEPEGSLEYHEETSSVLFDLEGISYATALSSPQKAQEIDGIQEAECNQDTEDTGESEEDPEEDDQWWGISDLKEDSAPPRILLRFSELPGKVRRQIWNFVRPEARYIKIRESKWSAAFYSDAPIPSLLHTCQESRKEAMKWYDLSFARDPEMGFWDQRTLNGLMDNAITEGQRAQPRIYFDWERDGRYSQCARCIAIE
ncbi:hypothetical protein EAF00_011024 [Botryotinia globosa]|nr:hypothetical protein EAF00_011024 [Botryotinia globosa]